MAGKLSTPTHQQSLITAPYSKTTNEAITGWIGECLVRDFLRNLFVRPGSAGHRREAIGEINACRAELRQQSNDELKTMAKNSDTLSETVAVAAVAAERLLGLEMFDEQLQGSLALADGKIAEMQTGEGKTLAAVPAIAWLAKAGAGVHVMTVNDYLARRDAQWMGPIYEFFGLSVGCIQQSMSGEERRNAYYCDITYSTANEIGFDFLRDEIALYPRDQVHRPFAAAVIDEADSILIDEARIPLVLAGGDESDSALVYRVDSVTRHLKRGVHYGFDQFGRSVSLTDAGIHAVERALGCANLFAEGNLRLFTAIQDSLHAHALLRRDVDYLVKDGAIESVDEFKGRVVPDRRWPAGLHSAVEAKEGVVAKAQGKILGSITIQNLIALYPKVCGMTGTAATQAGEFHGIYGLNVEVIATHRSVIRVDQPDKVFQTKRDKEQAVHDEILSMHETGRPVLIGTASVEESERLSAGLGALPHEVLNARNEEEEAEIIARAGEQGAVTVSTNMAGRGVDIRLGEGVAELGGLHVVGVNRHESRRIDHQLRGRAGRQGDPGSSQFFVSLEDDLLVKYGVGELDSPDAPERIQRKIETQNLQIREFLRKYEGVVEGQRQAVQERRQAILTGATECASELERLVWLATIDDLWSEHLAGVSGLREATQWTSWANHDPLYEYLKDIDEMFQAMEAAIEEEIPKRLAQAEETGLDPTERGATWTYLTTDQPFGSIEERIVNGLRRLIGKGKV
jgi:preprotein translocase subunit SecA